MTGSFSSHSCHNNYILLQMMEASLIAQKKKSAFMSSTEYHLTRHVHEAPTLCQGNGTWISGIPSWWVCSPSLTWSTRKYLYSSLEKGKHPGYTSHVCHTYSINKWHILKEYSSKEKSKDHLSYHTQEEL